LTESSENILTVSGAVWRETTKRARVISDLAEMDHYITAQVDQAASKLNIGRSRVCRLLARFKESRDTTSLLPTRPGRKTGGQMLKKAQERIISDLTTGALHPRMYGAASSARPRLVHSFTAAAAYAIRWSELIDRLNTEATIELERRSWFWPPAAHNALQRAIVSVGGQRSVFSASRLFSTDLGKTRRKGKHFY
jgi:transposase